ncbi:HTH-type transcriptional regulatory protein GabR [Pandoraea terrae]|uniref:HTH-type transcriptional regulatory protein GabR n=1 Tax=Pandoraea terrae TaxID=1537710 RepID=A0A5E4SXI3_9BURK|nr:PLP-dependent aminotransferase family protein [Pandoraea terrae]VVD78944.1 HTH-type transcriptional regulatory protein GabR [Pandoraea terrae]
MKTTSLDLADLTLPAGATAPAYRVLYERIRNGILSGKLAPASRLPSTRALASELGMARGTVEAAYELLVSEGFLIGRGAAGSHVNPQLAEPRKRPPAGVATAAAQSPVPARESTALIPVGADGAPLPMQGGMPAFDAFPRKLWARLAARHARHLPTTALNYQDPAGWMPLREGIANYLGIARGIRCDPGQIIVTAGFQGALSLAARVLLQPGDAVWCEDPGYFHAHDGLRLAGANLVPVPVDAQGLDVSAGEMRSPRARMAVVTPSHQAPMSVALPLARRLALLSWAQMQGAWIVEDDYDSEFRYTGAPLPALKSLDGGERVLYIGSFSKVLFPGLRLGYMVVPPALCDSFLAANAVTWPAQGWLEQATVAEFIEQGHFSRHIKRMRQLYGERRAALAQALARHLGGRVDVAAQAGGMHLLGWLGKDDDDVACAAAARRRGLAPAPLSHWRIAREMPPALVMSFTNVSPEAADGVTQRLAAAIAEASGRGR